MLMNIQIRTDCVMLSVWFFCCKGASCRKVLRSNQEQQSLHKPAEKGDVQMFYELKISQALAAVQRAVAQYAHLSQACMTSTAALCTLTALWQAYTTKSMPTTILVRQHPATDKRRRGRSEAAQFASRFWTETLPWSFCRLG